MPDMSSDTDFSFWRTHTQPEQTQKDPTSSDEDISEVLVTAKDRATQQPKKGQLRPNKPKVFGCIPVHFGIMHFKWLKICFDFSVETWWNLKQG